MDCHANSICYSVTLFNIHHRDNGSEVFVSWGSKENEAKHRDTLKSGTRITVQYYGTNIYGTLLSPQFWRIREDVI